MKVIFDKMYKILTLIYLTAQKRCVPPESGLDRVLASLLRY